ncbi:MAG: hypothetical protein C0440_04315 [Candidatus Pelagibacter sp.]|nr:hypothetical protein [Candidatus Pelagibacter sp.]
MHNGAGEMLIYNPVYNEIIEARREDDPTLSQGIWKQKPKIADWNKAENLTTDILINKSKDLRVLGWLIESWVMTQGLQGLNQSLILLQKFCETFWPVLYPNAYSIFEELRPEKDDNDSLFNEQTIPSDETFALYVAEHRIALFEWIDSTLSQRLHTLPLFQTESASHLHFISIADWIKYQDEYQYKKRLGSEEQIDNDFVQNITKIHINAITQLQDILNLNEDALKSLENTLLHFDLNKIVEFKNIHNFIHHARSMIHFYFKKNNIQPLEEKCNIPSNIMSEYTPPIPSSTDHASSPQIVSNRDDAYVALSQIKDFLNSIDPHSPSLMLLDLAIQWQNKSFVEIVDDIQNGNSSTHALLRIFNKN